eukprot:7276361-Alexandrium_andersonii.AAC.1
MTNAPRRAPRSAGALRGSSIVEHARSREVLGAARRGLPRFARRPRRPVLQLKGSPTSTDCERGTR